jgi:ribose transport system permease protein
MSTLLAGRLNRATLITIMPIAVLAALCLVIAINQPSFFRVQSLGLVVQISAPLIVLALGQTFVILTGGIDLSQAVLASLATVLIALWLPLFGPIGVLMAIATVTLCGVLNGLVVAVLQVPSFIVTLGAMSLWGAIAVVLSGASTISIPNDDFAAVGWLNSVRPGGVPLGALIAVALPIIAAIAMKLFTRGNAFHAVGLGEAAAQMAGLPTRPIRVVAFGLSGLMAALAGLLLTTTQYSGAPTLANALLLPVIAAVVIGGTAITGGQGGALRTLVGALVIGVLRVGMGIVGVDPAYEQIVYGVAVVLAVTLTLDRSRLRIVK